MEDEGGDLEGFQYLLLLLEKVAAPTSHIQGKAWGSPRAEVPGH